MKKFLLLLGLAVAACFGASAELKELYSSPIFAENSENNFIASDWSQVDAQGREPETYHGSWRGYSGDENTGGIPSVLYQYHSTQNADDYLVSKGFDLKAGVTYYVKFYLYRHQSYPEKLKVIYASGTDVQSLQNGITIVDYPSIPQKDPINADQSFTVPSDGEYHIAFHAYSDNDKGYIAVGEFSLWEDESAGPVTPAAPVLSVVASDNNDANATLTSEEGVEPQTWNIDGTCKLTSFEVNYKLSASDDYNGFAYVVYPNYAAAEAQSDGDSTPLTLEDLKAKYADKGAVVAAVNALTGKFEIPALGSPKLYDGPDPVSYTVEIYVGNGDSYSPTPKCTAESTVSYNGPQPVDVPYSSDMASWKVTDLNGHPGTTLGVWYYKSGAMEYVANQNSNPANDYLTSPGIKLYAGEKYTITYEAQGDNYGDNGKDKYEVVLSTGDDEDALKNGTTLFAEETLPTQFRLTTFDVDVPADGIYYISFYTNMEWDENASRVAVRDFSITEKKPEAPVVTADNDAVKVALDEDSRTYNVTGQIEGAETYTLNFTLSEPYTTMAYAVYDPDKELGENTVSLEELNVIYGEGAFTQSTEITVKAAYVAGDNSGDNSSDNTGDNTGDQNEADDNSGDNKYKAPAKENAANTVTYIVIPGTAEGFNPAEAYKVVSTVTTNVPTGVGTLEAEEGETAYYTLQGVRVANPGNGLYIKVSGGKATKVLRR